VREEFTDVRILHHQPQQIAECIFMVRSKNRYAVEGYTMDFVDTTESLVI